MEQGHPGDSAGVGGHYYAADKLGLTVAYVHGFVAAVDSLDLARVPPQGGTNFERGIADGLIIRNWLIENKLIQNKMSASPYPSS
jgi:hypothetical protein